MSRVAVYEGETPMILVTGGAGFVGSLLVPELIANGNEVVIVDALWFKHKPEHVVTWVDDVRQMDPRWVDGPYEAVIHLAGLSNDPTADFAPMLNAEMNVRATEVMARVLARRLESSGRRLRFLFASSCSVYYTSHSRTDACDETTLVAPTANYSKSKRLAEIALLRLADEYPNFCPVIFRKGTLFGKSPRMRFDLVVNAFTLQAWQAKAITVHGSGEAWRPLLHVRDAVDAYLYGLTAPESDVRGQIFNVAHKNYRIIELAHWVAEVLQEQRGVDVRVTRDRSNETGARSYSVTADKLEQAIGFRAERGIAGAVLEMWDALEAGMYGRQPGANADYFNIQRFKALQVA